MSVKKNLTVATLAALLAVPAFGATNVHASKIVPSTVVPTGRLTHAYRGYPAGTIIYDGHGPGGAAGAPNMENGALGHVNDNTHPLVQIPEQYVAQLGSSSNSDNWTNHVGSSIGRALMSKVKSLGGTYNSSNDTENLYYNGHHFELTGTASGVLIDGESATDAQALAMLDGANSSNNSNQSNGTPSNATENNSNTNDSTQYTSKKSLPQTGESNDASKAMALGAVALGTSASMMALSMAKKHRQEADVNSTISSEPVVDNDNKPNEYKSIYHMIMSDTFANISKDLKQM